MFLESLSSGELKEFVRQRKNLSEEMWKLYEEWEYFDHEEWKLMIKAKKALMRAINNRPTQLRVRKGHNEQATK